MRILASSLLYATLAVAAPASAAPIQITFGDGEGAGAGGAVWGPDFAEIIDNFDRAFVDGIVFGDVVVLPISVVGAVLQSYEVADESDGVANTVARYAGGFVRADVMWRLLDESWQTGWFQASIRELTFDVHARHYEDVLFGEVRTTLGRGSFDPLLADYLGIGSRSIRRGDYWMSMDYVEPDPESQAEWGIKGDWNGSDLELTVPEPSLLALGVTAAFALRRRRVRRSRSTSRRAASMKGRD